MWTDGTFPISLMTKYSNDIELALNIVGSLSAFCSVLVLITGIAFFKTMVKDKIYMQMIMMISLCDFISSISVSWGVPDTAELCSWQSGMGRFFFRSGWFWGAFMILTLWTYVKHGTLFCSFQAMNAICWGSNLVITVLPFTTGTTYGTDDDRLGQSLCTFKQNDTEKTHRAPQVKLWILVTYFIPCIVLGVLMLYLLILMHITVRSFDSAAGMRIQKLVRHTALYPLVVLLSWVPNCICFAVAEWGYPHTPTEYTYWNYIYLPTRISFVWAGLNGVFITIIFFFNSKEARQRWHAVLWSSDPTNEISTPDTNPECATKNNFRSSSMHSNSMQQIQVDFKSDDEYVRDSIDFRASTDFGHTASISSLSSQENPVHGDEVIDNGIELTHEDDDDYDDNDENNRRMPPVGLSPRVYNERPTMLTSGGAPPANTLSHNSFPMNFNFRNEP